MKAPCKDCPDRHPACHDHCGKYQAFHLERVRIHEAQARESMMYDGKVLGHANTSKALGKMARITGEQ
jgi:hypothetical protein